MRKIIKLKPKNRIFLAPMEEVNDIAFRLLCKKAGAGLTYTPMIHPKTPQKIYLEDKPILQLFCTNSKGIKEFMGKHDKQVSGWDFNLGCPATTAKKHGFGVFLHSDLKSIEEILKTMRKNTKKPLSVKIRISKYYLQIIEIANKYCDAICIHPRTQSQGYSGEPDIKFAKSLRQYTKLPLIYSGNVDEKNYKKLLADFDFVMIGRRAIGNPNVFAKTSQKKKFKEITFKDYLKLAEKYKLQFRQIKFQAMNFTKGKRNSKKLRLEIFGIKNIEDLKKINFSR